MSELYQNIYKTGRLCTGLTQEAAAERIGVSVESLRAYETGRRVPPCDIVERMVVCYQTPPLAYQHLRATSGLISYVVPELEARGVLESAVRVYLLLNRLAGSHAVDRLLEIAEGGSVGQEEHAEFEQIVTDLRELVRPCLELDVFWRTASKKPECIL